MASKSLTDAPQRGWGSGWPDCHGELMAEARGGGVAVHVRRELVPLVSSLLEQTVKLGYRLDQSQTGGFACRAMKRKDGSESETPSNHSWGLALDLNWRQNGFGHGTPHDIPANVVALWENAGFNWGGHWTGQSPDYMHFEYARRPADVHAPPKPEPEDDEVAKPVMVHPTHPLKDGSTPTLLTVLGSHQGTKLDRAQADVQAKAGVPTVALVDELWKLMVW